MLVVVTYDVSTVTSEGRRRLRRVAKVCEDYGQRVQNSVFECLLDPESLVIMRNRLLGIVDPEEDSLRFYFLGNRWRQRIERVCGPEPVDFEEPLVL